MHRNYKAAGVPVMVGVGAGIDFMAGRVKRAPVWMQNAGMEWLWRLSLEPRRLWRRYLVDDLLFLRLLAEEVLKHNWQPGCEQ
jgi:N-acetylglucosaminyldiphosphoundecaprenol N-acetyl-beta-D-mannosaminyltransferase